MVEFITTEHITAELQRLITECRESLCFVSPYLQLNERIISSLAKPPAPRKLTFICRLKDIKPAELQIIGQLPNTEVRSQKNLHAKCYINEATAIITSMNLYEYSQVNNDEMGILIRRREDPVLFEQVKSEVERLLRVSDRVDLKSTPADRVFGKSAKEDKAPPRDANRRTTTEGHCIRCAKEIPFDPGRPYCLKDYREWAEWEDENYEDAYCHGCGKDTPATMAKPLCRACYKKNAEF